MCARQIAVIFLVAINILLVLAGGVLIAIGVMASFFFDDVFEVASDNSDNSYISAAFQLMVNENYVTTVGYGVLAVGIVVFLLGFFGCAGAACSAKKNSLKSIISKILLFAYFVAVTLMLIAVVVLVIVIFFVKDTAIDEVEDDILTTLTDSFTEDYLFNSSYSTNAYAAAWTAAMQVIGCCGWNGGSDFDLYSETYSYKWRQFVCENVNSSICDEYKPSIPVSCCIVSDDAKVKMLSGTFNYTYLGASTCRYSPDDSNSYYSKGCLSTVETYLVEYTYWIIIVALIIVYILTFAIMSTCILLSEGRKESSY